MGLPTIVIILLLNYDSSIVIELAFKFNVVRKLDSEIVASTQGVKHPSIASLIGNSSRTFATQINDIYTVFTQDEEISSRQEKAFDRWLVQLEAFMQESYQFCPDVKHENVKGVATFSLVAYHQVVLHLIPVIFVSQEIQIHLSDIGLVLPIDKVNGIFLRIIYFYHQQIVSGDVILFVRKNVEVGIVGQNVQDLGDIFSIVYIHFKIGSEVDEKDISDWRHDALILLSVENAEVWWIEKEIPQRVDCLFLLLRRLVVFESDNLSRREKQKLIIVFVVKEKLAASVVVELKFHLLIKDKLSFLI